MSQTKKARFTLNVFYIIILHAVAMSFVSYAKASNNKSCVCEYGTYPSSQVGFFKTGCDIWLAQQSSCKTEDIVPMGTSYVGKLATEGTDHLLVGYVGHWSSSEEMVEYLKSTIVPVLNEGYSVTVDNTACKGMKNPEVIFEYVQSIHSQIKSTQFLNIQANQNNSIGKWDILLGKSHNVNAIISTNADSIKYPSCSQHKGRNCIQQLQLNNKIQCENKKGQLETLYCCKLKPKLDYFGYPVKSDAVTNNRYAWETEQKCDLSARY